MTDPTENNLNNPEPEPDEIKDYYEILGVSRDATETQIDEAVDRLQKKLRRELEEVLSLEEQQVVKDKFRELTDMYHVLTDSKKSRAAYDKKLQETKPQQEVAPKEDLKEEPIELREPASEVSNPPEEIDKVIDYYEFLGVSRNAKQKEIYDAADALFDKLSDELNKAENPEEKEAIQGKLNTIRDLFDVLINNEESRRTYDEKLKEKESQKNIGSLEDSDLSAIDGKKEKNELQEELGKAFQVEQEEQQKIEKAYEAAYHAYGDTVDTPEKELEEGISEALQEHLQETEEESKRVQEEGITAVIEGILHSEQELTDEEKEKIWDSADSEEMSPKRLAEILEEIKANSTEQKIKEKINEVLAWIQTRGVDIAKGGIKRGAELGSRYVGKPALGASKFLGGGALLGISGIFAGIAGAGYGIYKGAEGIIDFVGGFLGKIGKLIWQGRIYMGEGESKEGDLFDLYQDFRHRLRWRHRLWHRKEEEHKKSSKS